MHPAGNAAVSGRCSPPDPTVRGSLQPGAVAQRHRIRDSGGHARRKASRDSRRQRPEVGSGARTPSTAPPAGRMKHGVTMILPGETEAGSAGMQPCRGIAWWAHRDEDRECGNHSPALPPTIIGSKDPDALKIPARRAEFTLTENARPPFQAEPEQCPISESKRRRNVCSMIEPSFLRPMMSPGLTINPLRLYCGR